MSIEFSRHALEKALLRNVKMRDIRRVLRFPDELFEDVEHGVTVAIKKVDGRSIMLAFRREDGLVKVITLYYTTKLDGLVKSKLGRGVWRRIK